MQDITITLLQAELAWQDRQANLDQFTRRLGEITEASDMIVLPEMFTTGFTIEAKIHAEPMEGPSMRWMMEQSSRKQTVIIGSLIIQEDDEYYNRLIWMRPDGTYDWYDKRHLFSYARENLSFSKGNRILVTEYKGWRFQPQICYDLRFPVWSANRFRHGHYAYDCLIYLANWPDPRRHAWKTLLCARAIENLAYVAGVNRVGTDGKGLRYAGDSAICDLMGKVIAGADPYQEATITARLSYKELTQIREQFAFGKDWDNYVISD